MEEKERYEVISPSLNGYAYIHDFNTDNVLNTYDSCDLLNQQDAKIKELERENQKANIKNYLTDYYLVEKENQQLREDLQAKDILVNTYMSVVGTLDNAKQLKQAQKEFAIEELTMFGAILTRAVQCDNDSKCWTISEEVFGNFIVQIDEKIEELKGEE